MLRFFDNIFFSTLILFISWIEEPTQFYKLRPFLWYHWKRALMAKKKANNFIANNSKNYIIAPKAWFKLFQALTISSSWANHFRSIKLRKRVDEVLLTGKHFWRHLPPSPPPPHTQSREFVFVCAAVLFLFEVCWFVIAFSPLPLPDLLAFILKGNSFDRAF